MRKLSIDNRLHPRCSKRGRRAAFSLAELIVSIGVLTLLLALAGQVMSITVQSTGQAKALTQVNQTLRMFEQTLRRDLANVPAGRSAMVIVGNPVNAYWTQDGKDVDADLDPSTGYAHAVDPERELPDNRDILQLPRADMLMFFTADDSARSYFYSEVGSTVSVASAYQQVVYGHVIPGDYTVVGTGNDRDYEFTYSPALDPFPPYEEGVSTRSPVVDPEAVSPVPAEQWHLGRRTVLIRPDDVSQMVGYGDVMPSSLASPELTNGWFGTNGDFERAQVGFTDIVQIPLFTRQVLWPVLNDPWGWPSILNYPEDGDVDHRSVPFARSFMDPDPPAKLTSHLAHYLLPNCASFKVEWTLDPDGYFAAGRLDTEGEIYWFDPGEPYDPDAPRASGPFHRLSKEADRVRAVDADDAQQESMHNAVLRRARLDGLLSDLYWRFGFNGDAGDLDSFGTLDTGGAGAMYEEYGVEGRPNVAVFTADYAKLEQDGEIYLGTQNPGDSYTVPLYVFPAALRITVDVVDPQHRLERPTRHVMVIPVGQGD